jgi:hypothetical protein
MRNSAILPNNWLSVAERLFILSASVLLLATGISKLISITGSAQVLDRSDPIFTFLTARQMLLIAAIPEIGIAALAFFRIGVTQSVLMWIGWLASLFGLYRFGLWLVGSKQPCKCLGGALEWLGLSDHVLRHITLGAFLYLLLGAYVLLLINVFKSRGARARMVRLETTGGEL